MKSLLAPFATFLALLPVALLRPEAPSPAGMDGAGAPQRPAAAAAPEAGSAARAALSLSALGSCPWPMAFTVSGATPGGTVVLLWSFHTGSATIPAGRRCGGTVLGLASPQFASAANVDPSGVAFMVVAGVPPSACGRAFLQALDVAGCGTSNVLPL